MGDTRTKLSRQIERRSTELWGSNRSVELLGVDSTFKACQTTVQRASRCTEPVLVTGESGVGKELFARSLHVLGPRSESSFLTVNCALYQDGDTLVSELFGHTKGSFTGAMSSRDGLFTQADGGTLFLDEISEMGPKAQAMLLRALSEGEVRPLGSNESHHVDVRIIAATNRDLRQMVDDGAFREDLYYRLCYVCITIPPLRDRGDDWLVIAQSILQDLSQLHGEVKQLTPGAIEWLGDYSFPGNVRELKGVIQASYFMSQGRYIDVDDLNLGPSALEGPSGDGLAEGKVEMQPVSPPDASISDELATPTETSAAERGADPESSSDTSGSDSATAPMLRRGVVLHRYRRMVKGGEDFWTTIHEDYLDRELNRAQVRDVVTMGLEVTGGSYKDLVPLFNMPCDDYSKFMDFLRHHRLKPSRTKLHRIRSREGQDDTRHEGSTSGGMRALG